jgi:hypothetical protein
LRNFHKTVKEQDNFNFVFKTGIMLISQIEDIFLEIENLIKLQLQDEILNQPVIEQKFKEGKELIDKLEEEDDDEQHGLFKYKYHVTNSNYLTTIGEVDKASIQEKIAMKFKKFSKEPKKIDTYKTESRLFLKSTLSDINQVSNSEKENEEDIRETLEEELENIKNIIEDNVIESIRETFKRLNVISKSFEDYKNIVTCEIVLHRLADNPINESLIDLETSQTSNTSNDQKSKTKENKQNLISSLNI